MIGRFNLRTDFAGNKCKLRNNFRTVIFDIPVPSSKWYWIEVVSHISKASQSGITKIVAILGPLSPKKHIYQFGSFENADRRAESIRVANREIGVDGTCSMVGDKQVWTWEKNGGGALEI